MQIEYRRDLNHNYVVLESNQPVQTDGYQVRMILSNDIAGFLPCTIQQMDGRALFCYEMTSRQSLQSLLGHRELTHEQLIQKMGQVLDAIEQLQIFLLNPDDLVLNAEVVFEANGGGELAFCYLPGFRHPIRQSLRELIEYLLPKIDHKNKQAVAVGYGLYRKIMEENWSIEELRELIFSQSGNSEKDIGYDAAHRDEREPQEIEREQLLDQFFEPEEEETKKKSWVGMIAVCVLAVIFVLLRILHVSWLKCGIVMGGILLIIGIAYGGWYMIHVFVVKHSESEDTSRQRKQVNAREISDAGDEPGFKRLTSVREYSGDETSAEKIQNESSASQETELLYKPEVITGARLIAVKPTTLQTIFLNKDLILIGTLAQAVDAVILSGAVSRIHAKVKRVEGGYVLSDLSSKNGTFVNAHMLIGEEEYRLQEGDEVQFAEVVYRYFPQ